MKKRAPIVKKELHHRKFSWKQNTKQFTQLAKEYNYPPYLLLRLILEQITHLKGSKLTQVLRNPETFTLPETLSDAITATKQRELITAILNQDPLYGPRHDRARHFIGIEYEVVLEDYLRRHHGRIPIVTEATLRERGTSKTPDVLLEIPLAIYHRQKWRMICWIDSKALFGDIHTHQTNVMAQANAYVHRFGPGLIVYWMGYASSIVDDSNEDIVVVEDIAVALQKYMLPTGEIVQSKQDDDDDKKSS